MTNDPVEARTGPSFPLSSIEVGARVRIAALLAGRGLAERIADMGLPVGSEIEIVQRQSGGRLIVAREFARVALGGGMAQKILVERV